MPSRRIPAPVLWIVVLLTLGVLVALDLSRPASFLRDLVQPGPPRRGLEILRDDMREEFQERGPTRPIPLPR